MILIIILKKNQYIIKIYTNKNNNFNEFDDCLQQLNKERICNSCTII